MKFYFQHFHLKKALFWHLNPFKSKFRLESWTYLEHFVLKIMITPTWCWGTFWIQAEFCPRHPWSLSTSVSLSGWGSPPLAWRRCCDPSSQAACSRRLRSRSPSGSGQPGHRTSGWKYTETGSFFGHSLKNSRCKKLKLKTKKLKNQEFFPQKLNTIPAIFFWNFVRCLSKYYHFCLKSCKKISKTRNCTPNSRKIIKKLNFLANPLRTLRLPENCSKKAWHKMSIT